MRVVETLHRLDLTHDYFFVTFQEVLAHNLHSHLPLATIGLIAGRCANHAKGALAERLVERIVLLFRWEVSRVEWTYHRTLAVSAADFLLPWLPINVKQ